MEALLRHYLGTKPTVAVDLGRAVIEDGFYVDPVIHKGLCTDCICILYGLCIDSIWIMYVCIMCVCIVCVDIV